MSGALELLRQSVNKEGSMGCGGGREAAGECSRAELYEEMV